MPAVSPNIYSHVKDESKVWPWMFNRWNPVLQYDIPDIDLTTVWSFGWSWLLFPIYISSFWLSISFINVPQWTFIYCSECIFRNFTRLICTINYFGNRDVFVSLSKFNSFCNCFIFYLYDPNLNQIKKCLQIILSLICFPHILFCIRK